LISDSQFIDISLFKQIAAIVFNVYKMSHFLPYILTAVMVAFGSAFKGIVEFPKPIDATYRDNYH